MKPPRILIIAGSDSGGGAGIQADIKTVTMLGGFAMTAITAITAQNTIGVDAVVTIPTEMVVKQIDAVVNDLGVDAIKIGMIGSPEIAAAVANRLEGLAGVPIIFDPVMVASSGASLADDETIRGFHRLIALSTIITPNLPELQVLAGKPLEDEEAIIEAAAELRGRFGCAVVAKGGHGLGDDVIDILVAEQTIRQFSKRQHTAHTHGTGCTLASAIAVGLGSGLSADRAFDRAVSYVQAAIASAPGYGSGCGPIGHGLDLVAFHLWKAEKSGGGWDLKAWDARWAP